MRTTALLLALLLVAGGAAAQEEAPAERQRPDYSRNTLLRLFADAGDDDDQRAIRVGNGALLEVRGLAMTFRLMGVLPPLSGSEFRTVMNTLPDPFALTGTSIATSPRAWRTQRQRSRELRRIEDTERAKIRVTTR
jgi:hypothetical protein